MLRDKNNYYYDDCYMYFTFAGVYSKKYNLFVVNSKGFTKVNTVGASVKTEAPDYQDMQYYLGTTRSKKTIKIDVATEGLTLDEYKNMMLWLSEGRTGFLYFDSDVDWGWDVVISKIGDATYNPNKNGDIYEFNIQFDTIGTYKARTPWDIVFNVDDVFEGTITNGDKTNSEYTIANKWGIPELIYAKNENNNKIIYLPVIGNCGGYFNYGFLTNGNNSTLKISKDNIDYINYTFSHESKNYTIKYYGNSNYVIANNNSLVETEEGLVTKNSINNQVNGLLTLEGQGPQLVDYIDINTSRLILTKEQSDLLSYMKNFYISISYLDLTKYSNYSSDGYDDYPYPYQFYNIIFFDPIIENNIITFSKQTWNRNMWSELPDQKPIITYGNYNTIKIENTGATNSLLYLYKYNNM